MSPRLKEQANWFLATEANGTLETYFPSLTREHASLIDEFWRDPAIQATFKRRAEIPMLPDVAQHFLEKVVEISTTTYSPTEKDILYTEGVVHDSGFTEIEFSMDEEDGRQSGPYNDSTMEAFAEARYHVIRLSRNCIGDNYKLLKMFEDVQVLIFCVALDCYDQILPRGKTAVAASSRNQMLVSRDLFENVLKFPAYESKPVVLFLNKFDAFQEKLSNVPLTACEWFSDYDPVRSSRNTPEMLAQQAYTYIARMFKKHFEMIRPGGKLFTFSLRALEGGSVKGAFRYVKDVLILEEMNRMANRGWQSHYITETSTLTVTAN